VVSDPSPEHVRVTVQQSLQCIEDILGLAAGFDTEWIPDDEKQPAFLVGYGLYMATRRLTQAAVLLSRSGLEHESASLRRSLIEHASFLAWLADDPTGAVAAINREHQSNVRRGEEAMSKGGYDTKDITELVHHVLRDAAPASSTDHLLGHTHRLQRYGQPPVLAQWLHDTFLTHPTLIAARFYFQEGESITLAASPREELPTTPLQAAIMLHAASVAFSGLLTGDPWRAELARINEDYGLGAPTAGGLSA